MGVNIFDKNRFESVVRNFEPNEIDVVELGDQYCVVGGICDPNYKFRDLYKDTFKTWRTLDLWPGENIEIFDLSEIHCEKQSATIITNFGTSEHVEPEIGQYNCWVNLHNMLRVGGYILHTVPPKGDWLDHCRYFHTEEFFERFRDIGYEVVELRREFNNILLCTLKKVKDIEFLSQEDFFSIIHFEKKSSDEIHPINNPKNIKF